MNQSYALDMACIKKILKYTQSIRYAYEVYKIGSASELSENELCHLAITQILTNIYEAKEK